MDGIDMYRNVVSPTLFNPAWGDLENFVYYLDFDLGVDADFLPEAVLTSTEGYSNGRKHLGGATPRTTELYTFCRRVC